MEFQRYVARTEAWARQVEDESEEIVGSNGRVTAYRGDYEVKQNMRGQLFNYVMTEDEFQEDWVLAEEKDTNAATSDTGVDELTEATPQREGEEAPVSQSAAVPTAGTATESPSPADTPQDDEEKDVTPGRDADEEHAGVPTAEASAPTSGGAAAGEPPPAVGSDTDDVSSPVSGAGTPPVPDPAPAGSSGSETTQQEGTADVSEPQQPEPTTPSQTVAPAQEETAEDTPAQATTRDDGGDAGQAPTPSENVTEENADTANTGNVEGKAKTLPGKRTSAGTEATGQSADSAESPQ